MLLRETNPHIIFQTLLLNAVAGYKRFLRQGEETSNSHSAQAGLRLDLPKPKTETSVIS
jgi:hypothetical protein